LSSPYNNCCARCLVLCYQEHLQLVLKTVNTVRWSHQRVWGSWICNRKGPV